MHNSKYKVLLAAVGMTAVLIGGFFALNGYIYNEKQSNELSQEQRETLVAGYIEKNISELSPESEVLGGTFYVTNIEFTGTNSGTVDYEDGHIALIADFEYSITEEDGIEVELSTVRGK